MQENVRECSKTREICEYFLSRTIPDIWYAIIINPKRTATYANTSYHANSLSDYLMNCIHMYVHM